MIIALKILGIVVLSVLAAMLVVKLIGGIVALVKANKLLKQIKEELDE